MSVPERVRFFPGQALGASDFETEQGYQIKMRRLHNQWLHGAGVVEGLNVSINATGVVVTPGFALDGLGREIIVETPAHLALGAVAKESCFVTLRYLETATTPAPTPKGVTEFSRIREGFSAGTAEDDPQGQASGESVGIARLIKKEGHWMVDGSYKPKRPRGVT